MSKYRRGLQRMKKDELISLIILNNSRLDEQAVLIGQAKAVAQYGLNNSRDYLESIQRLKAAAIEQKFYIKQLKNKK